MNGFLRTWWPLLALVALALLSIQMLRRSQGDAHRLVQQTATSLENVQESRRRLINAYLIHSRRALDDRTFDHASPSAELIASEHALTNWLVGRSGIVEFSAAPPLDPDLLRLGRNYRHTLQEFQAALTAGAGAVVMRQRYSAAEQAAVALEIAITTSLRESVRARTRAYRLRLTGWTLLLVVSLCGAAVTHRALHRSELGRTDSEFRLSRLRELAPVGIVECDAGGRVLAANWMWGQLTGVQEKDWHGRPWWNALQSADREAAQRLWERSRTGQDQLATVEARLEAKSRDAPTWLLIRVGNGNPSDMQSRRVVTFTDITQQRNTEEQLHHAQRMEAVGQLAGGVAHDFNNLLTSIRGFASLALDATHGNEQLQADLLEVERAADRGHALTRQLLTFSRQDRMDRQLIDVRDIVTGLSRMLDRLVRESVQIHTRLGEAPANVLADRGQIEQIITNLVINASDAIEHSGHIHIGVGTVHVEDPFRGARSDIPPGEYVLLSVSDDGPGIPPDVQERIFEPFFTTKERGKGTGLGLSTVWGIVRQSDGHIHLYSAPGQGTVFKIYLPAARTQDAPQQLPPAAAAEPAPAPGTALVVDDEDAVRRLTTRVLQLRGWTVLEAADGERALRIVDEHGAAIDVLITDLMMRGMGGVELARKIRERGIELPTVFVSGYPESELDLAGAAFLEKPFTPRDLIRVVNTILMSRP